MKFAQSLLTYLFLASILKHAQSGPAEEMRIILKDFTYIQRAINLMKTYADSVKHVRNNLQSIHEGLETSYNDTILLRDYRHILSRCDLKALLAKNTERALVNKMNVVIIEFGTIQHGLTWINSVANRIEHMKRHVDYVHDSL
ncbi:hypothetical protein CRM22_010724 [Opisthorchis felineus]|uniref:Prolyl 4-hydroxylase alpha-subunit N-terminal domain-containing protein n=1 Tax=Opisthorchis felineus TaxID=147828 RepID=A0A4S2KPF0_OPIFE|nr:hypothetical protein CRM22_010724 [Opisthorchis felineus]